MGAMHNDLNRCNFMYADDRRCLNLRESAGSSLCYYHNRKKQKEAEREARCHALPQPDSRASRALSLWLATHPLDRASHINRLLNQIFLCLAGNLISVRQADSMVRMARLLANTLPDVRKERIFPGLREPMQPPQQFFAEMEELLALACSQEKEDSESPQQESHTSAPSSPEAGDTENAIVGSSFS